MLTLDIETLGLLHHQPLPPMTCACLYDGVTRYELAFYNISDEEYSKNSELLIRLLDEAPLLAGYNAVLFDLPYIGRSLGVDHGRISSWVMKCMDPYIGFKNVLKQTSKLQRVLDFNRLASKTGSGSDAITLALTGKMKELIEYCMNDVLVTHSLCLLPEIRFSDTQGVRWVDETMDWAECRYAPPVLTLASVLLGPSDSYL